jgi:hypothetical protein
MRIDLDAARWYSSEEEDLMTPVKPSEKAMGKRRATIAAPPDDEELGVYWSYICFEYLMTPICSLERREEAEMEEAFMCLTALPEKVARLRSERCNMCTMPLLKELESWTDSNARSRS